MSQLMPVTVCLLVAAALLAIVVPIAGAALAVFCAVLEVLVGFAETKSHAG